MTPTTRSSCHTKSRTPVPEINSKLGHLLADSITPSKKAGWEINVHGFPPASIGSSTRKIDRCSMMNSQASRGRWGIRATKSVSPIWSIASNPLGIRASPRKVRRKLRDASINLTVIPRCTSNIARVKPVGPAPIITTWLILY